MSEKLLPCRCGNPGSTHETDQGRWSRICVRCGAQTPFYETEADSDAAWNRMQSETFTREDIRAAIAYGLARGTPLAPTVEHLNTLRDAFLAQRGK